MLRFGTITEVDPAKGYARVTFTDDGIVSDWLQVLTLGAIKDSFSHTFSINEQVACLMDENSEEGVILGALNNDKTPPNGAGDGIFRVKFEDNSVIEYNKNTHKYSINIIGEVDITAPVIKLTGAVAIAGALTVTGTISAPSGAPLTGNLEVLGDMKAGTVSLKTHVHTSATPGNPTTAPIP